MLSQHIPDGLAQVKTWNLSEVVQAHQFLDELEARDAAAKAAVQQ